MRQPPRLLGRALKKVYITPTRPQARQDAPLPDLRSRLVKLLNVAHLRKEPVFARWGQAAEISYASGFDFGCGLVG